MTRGLLLFFSFLCFGLLVISTSKKYAIDLQTQRYDGKSVFKSDRYRNGDLYGFSYLPQFKNYIATTPQVKLETETVNRCVNLVTLCDSYVWIFLKNDSVLSRVNKSQILKWDDNPHFVPVELDSHKVNVLLLETTERQVRTRLKAGEVKEKIKIVAHKSEAPIQEQAKSDVLDFFFNKKLETNLEFLLFDYSFLTPLKEWKASFHLTHFHRTDRNVTLSPTQDRLYYYQTTDSSLLNSSYYPLGEEELATLVADLNEVYEHYKKAGFDEVYLSIIPNPVTIEEPESEKYNQLIPRIQNAEKLRLPLIDVYRPYKTSSFPLYERADTHWNTNGWYIWVNEFNKTIEKTLQTKSGAARKCAL